jgi:acetyl-CoA carboxylase biotin carboxylase subunit
MPFTKVLVANRGEIAIRIIRALKDLGIKSVAVYSDVDRLARHVRYADEAFLLGNAPVHDSYLNIEKIIKIALEAGVDAIHPGYGFLSENAIFAQNCADAGVVFIGPSVESINLLGNKANARELAKSVDIPVISGTRDFVELEDAISLAEGLSYPIAVKASFGGGGRGIRFANSKDQLAEAAAIAQKEAFAAFGNGTLYLEAQLRNVRHIEIQIIADNFGNIIPLGERECSIQRRNQKLIEECPSLVISPELRRTLSRAAVRLARAANYQNIGTVEFLVTPEQNFFFLEMNTRLQVEHPVTEFTMGVDLVKDQISVAANEELTYDEGDLLSRGWAIECRVVSEDPFMNFKPSIGRVVFTREPAGPGIRVESALYDGVEVTAYYDSLLAKVTAWGPDRENARLRLQRALKEFKVIGVATNIPYLQQILDSPDFILGNVDTSFLDSHKLTPLEPDVNAHSIVAIAAGLIRNQEKAQKRFTNPDGMQQRPNKWREAQGAFKERSMGRWIRNI